MLVERSLTCPNRTNPDSPPPSRAEFKSRSGHRRTMPVPRSGGAGRARYGLTVSTTVFDWAET